MSIVTLGLIQTHATDDKADNLRRTITLVRDATKRGAKVVCLEELFLTPYFCKREDTALFDLAEPIPGDTTKILSDLSRELGVVIIASLFEKRAPGLYHNTAAVIDADGSYMGKFRKMHIPEDPGFNEKFYFTPGDQGYRSGTPSMAS